MTEEKKEIKELYRTVRLSELEAKLPVFPASINGRNFEKNEFSFCEWTMETEEKLSEIQNKSKNNGEFVNQMLCLLLDSFCGISFVDLPENEKTIIINQLEFPNVMYMYIYLRYEELGSEIKMDIECPAQNCKKMMKDFTADLGSLEIRVKDKEHSRKGTYELKKPILIGDKTITAFKYDVPKWDYLEKATDTTLANNGMFKKLMLEASVVGIQDGGKDSEGYNDVVNLVKKMKKFDIEKLIALIVENNSGALMSLEGKCEHCKTEFRKQLNWTFDYFFDSSSL